MLGDVRHWDHWLVCAGSSSWRMAFSNAKDHTTTGQGTMWAWVEGCLNLLSCQKLMLKLPVQHHYIFWPDLYICKTLGSQSSLYPVSGSHGSCPSRYSLRTSSWHPFSAVGFHSKLSQLTLPSVWYRSVEWNLCFCICYLDRFMKLLVITSVSSLCKENERTYVDHQQLCGTQLRFASVSDKDLERGWSLSNGPF